MRYLISIGGNALGKGSEKYLSKIAMLIAKLHLKGNDIIVTHGNGPQVGELALSQKKTLAELTGETQAEIGLHIENKIYEALLKIDKRNKKTRHVATLLTRVIVEPSDPEFKKPTKPVGAFYMTLKQAKKERSYKIRKFRKGYRRVVPSPVPLKILEAQLAEDLLKQRYIVIAAGGGGAAVFFKRNKITYADAVIDKDSASALLALQLKVDKMFILTDVDGAYTNFGTRRQKLIRKVSSKELKKYMDEFGEGSMLPKAKACIEFVEKSRKLAAIGSLMHADKTFAMKDCTVIEN